MKHRVKHSGWVWRGGELAEFFPFMLSTAPKPSPHIHTQTHSPQGLSQRLRPPTTQFPYRRRYNKQSRQSVMMLLTPTHHHPSQHWQFPCNTHPDRHAELAPWAPERPVNVFYGDWKWSSECLEMPYSSSGLGVKMENNVSMMFKHRQ